MLRVYIPEEYHLDQRVSRAIDAFAAQTKGEITGKAVWAVADSTAAALDPMDYRKYDWSDVDTLCIGGDDEILVDMDVIKPEHDVITIPGLKWSLYADQAIAILLNHYNYHYPCKERDEYLVACREMKQQERDERRGAE